MKQLTDEARANLSAAALKREAKKRAQKAASQVAPTPQAQPEVMQAPLPVARPDHQALMPLPGDVPTEAKPSATPSKPTASAKPAKRAQGKESSLPRRALLQSIGVAQTDNPELREAWSRVAQADRTIGQLRAEAAKREGEAEELRTEAKRNKGAWEQARAEAARFQGLLGQVGEVAGVYPEGRTSPVLVEAVRHLRQRADKALELEQQASGMNARAAKLEGELEEFQKDLASYKDFEEDVIRRFREYGVDGWTESPADMINALGDERDELKGKIAEMEGTRELAAQTYSEAVAAQAEKIGQLTKSQEAFVHDLAAHRTLVVSLRQERDQAREDARYLKLEIDALKSRGFWSRLFNMGGSK